MGYLGFTSLQQIIKLMLPKNSGSEGLYSQNYEDSLRNSESLSIQEQILTISTQKLTQSKIRLQKFIEQNLLAINAPIPQDIARYINSSHQKKLISQNITHQFIIKHVKTRINKMIKNRKIKKNWSLDDLRMLVWIVSAYCNIHGKRYSDLGEKDWQEISAMIPGADGETIMFKWLGLRKNNLAMQQWREHQKSLLKQIIESTERQNWSEIAKLLYKMNTDPNKVYRGPKQCRQHWNCYLNPDLKKGPWDQEEDRLLMTLVHKFDGQKKWALFVKQFGGRTENALKNRFYLLLDREKIKIPTKTKNMKEIQIVESYLKRTMPASSRNENYNQKSEIFEDNVDSQEEENSLRQRILRRKLKRGSRKADQDWITGFKTTNYTTYRKLEKSLKRNKTRHGPITPTRNKKQEPRDTVEQTRQKSTEKQSIIGDSSRKQSLDVDPNPQIPVLHLNPIENNPPKNQQAQPQNEYIPLEQVTIVQLTKQKIESLKQKIYNFVPCELLKDRLKLLKYPKDDPEL